MAKRMPEGRIGEFPNRRVYRPAWCEPGCRSFLVCARRGRDDLQLGPFLQLDRASDGRGMARRTPPAGRTLPRSLPRSAAVRCGPAGQPAQARASARRVLIIENSASRFVFQPGPVPTSGGCGRPCSPAVADCQDAGSPRLTTRSCGAGPSRPPAGPAHFADHHGHSSWTRPAPGRPYSELHPFTPALQHQAALPTISSIRLICCSGRLGR